VIEYGHKTLGLYASWKKNEIAVIDVIHIFGYRDDDMIMT
jgi:hypothetical protein